jgi:hypothetical protein
MIKVGTCTIGPADHKHTMTRRIHQAVCKYSIIANNAVYQKLLPPVKEKVEKLRWHSTADNPIG